MESNIRVLMSIFLLSLAVLLLLISTEVDAKTVTVSENELADYVTIQEAIDNATEGDTICVWAGTYFENVVVNKSLSLIGNGSELTTIDGRGVRAVVAITADWVNMSGFHILGSSSSDSGIQIESNSNFIHNNTCNNSSLGISLENSNNNTIINNTASDNNFGIYLQYSHNNAIINNTASGNFDGIHLYFSNNTVLINNIVSDNGEIGIKIHNSNNNSITNNTASNNTFSGVFEWGIRLYFSNNNTITNNTASNLRCFWLW